MNTFTLEIWYDEGNKCTFYTIKWDTEDEEDILSETDSFFEKYTIESHPFKSQAYELFTLITKSIGDKYGAIDDFFDRVENKAQALPPKPKQRLEEIYRLGINFPLRLFCYRVSKEIVILLTVALRMQLCSGQQFELPFPTSTNICKKN